MKKAFLILVLLNSLACATSSSTPTDQSSGNQSANCPALDQTWSLVLTRTDEVNPVTSPQVSLQLVASNPVRNITSYYLSDSDVAPSADAPGWISVTAASTIDLQTIFTLTPGDGNKTIYAWVKNGCEEVSSMASTDSFVLDTEAPTGTFKFNEGDKLTVDPNVILTLQAHDVGGIVSYFYSRSSTVPTSDDPRWINIEKTTDLNLTWNIVLEAPLSGSKSAYSWIKDSANRITALNDDIEVLNARSISEAWGNDFNIGQYSSIAVDSHDQPFIATNLKNLGNINDVVTAIKDENTQDGFTFGPVDYNGTGQGTSIVIDSEDRIHIAYKDSTHNTLKYATLDLRNPGNYQFTTETIEAGGIGPSIAVDSNNKVHIAHGDLQANTRYVTNFTGSWQGERLMTGDRFFDAIPNGLAIAPDGSVHIVRYGNGIEHATNTSGNWVVEPVPDANAYGAPSVAINDNGLYVSYEKPRGGIVLGKIINSKWTFTPIAEAPTGVASIALDSQGFVHIVYYGANKDLIYATNYSGTWKTMTLDSTGDVGDFCDIAIDHHDRLHISYYDYTNTDLKYATTADDP